MVDIMDRQDGQTKSRQHQDTIRSTWIIENHQKYASEENRTTKPAILETKEMSTVPVPAVYNTEQVIMLKSIVLDPGQFDRD